MSDEETGQRPDWAKRYIDEVMGPPHCGIRLNGC